MCTGPFLVYVWDFLSFHGSVASVHPKQGEGKERGGRDGDKGEDIKEALLSLLLKCYRGLCPFHRGGISSLYLLCLFHPPSVVWTVGSLKDTDRELNKVGLQTHTHTGWLLIQELPHLSSSFTLVFPHFPFLSHFEALSSPPWPLVNVTNTENKEISRRGKPADRSRDFWRNGEITYTCCHVVKSSRGVCRHPDTHTGTGNSHTLALAETRSKCGLLQVLRGERGRWKPGEDREKDIWRKTAENDGAAGVQVGWQQKAQVSLSHIQISIRTIILSLNLILCGKSII